MANYGQVSYGSKGSDVTELQKLLKNNGYSDLAVDGIFGSQTQDAVKKYQQANGLAVDGIVGNNTWAALTGSGQTQTPAQTTPEAAAPKFEYKPYTPSDTVTQAEALLQQQMANKPGEYQSTWQDQLNQIIQQIQNREKFSYDLNGDALYQQYKDTAKAQGNLAMMDTMGQAAAMTGGYGNSYAQSVGQQAYQGYLQGLNDKIPELYQLALNQYNTEGQALYDQASLIAGMEDQAYGRYRDTVSDHYTQLGLAQDEARYQAEQDYGKWSDNLSFLYQQDRDKTADEQWQATFDEGVRQYNEQMALSKGSSSSPSSSSDRGDNDSGYDTHGYTEDEIKQIQAAAGIAEDGIWGPDTEKAYNAGYRPDSSPAGNPTPTGEPTGTFTTYGEAVAHIKANGGSAAGLMDSSTWARHRNSYLTTGQGGSEVKEFATYRDYLAWFVNYAIETAS